MKAAGARIGKILRNILLILAALICVFLPVRAVGKAVNNRTPNGGINESMYVDINGTRQWKNFRKFYMR